MEAKFEETMERIKNNDPTLVDIDFYELFIENKRIIRLCEALKENTHVKILNLSRNEVEGDMIKKFVELLTVNKNFETIDLFDNYFGEEGGSALLDALIGYDKLRLLRIKGVGIGNECSVKIGQMLRANKNLKVLDIGWNLFECEGIKEIMKALENNKTLTELDIGKNKFVDISGKEAIYEYLKTNKSLETLKMYDIKLGDTGAEKLGEALKLNQGLINLDISCNFLTDKGGECLIESLKENKKIKVLKFEDNSLSTKIITLLKEQLKK